MFCKNNFRKIFVKKCENFHHLPQFPFWRGLLRNHSRDGERSYYRKYCFKGTIHKRKL